MPDALLRQIHVFRTSETDAACSASARDVSVGPSLFPSRESDRCEDWRGDERTLSQATFFTLSMADSPDVISANGGATLVWVDFPTKKTVALPDDLRAACS